MLLSSIQLPVFSQVWETNAVKFLHLDISKKVTVEFSSGNNKPSDSPL